MLHSTKYIADTEIREWWDNHVPPCNPSNLRTLAVIETDRIEVCVVVKVVGCLPPSHHSHVASCVANETKEPCHCMDSCGNATRYDMADATLFTVALGCMPHIACTFHYVDPECPHVEVCVTAIDTL